MTIRKHGKHHEYQILNCKSCGCEFSLNKSEFDKLITEILCVKELNGFVCPECGAIASQIQMDKI